MAIKPVLRMGDPKLRRIAEPVKDFDTPQLYALIQDMLDTKEAKMGVGIAAPQIDVNLRVVIYGFESSSRYPHQKPVPITVLINPEIKILSKESEDLWEGCLCVPGIRGLVTRPTHIYYRGYDPKGQVLEGEVKDFHARMIQHETDHLNGILFPSRVTNLQMLGFEDELKDTIDEFYARRNSH